MWSDIETSEDLLGYSVHASLIKKVVTNSKNLPITIGLYGDWGSGKSSVLKIVQKMLEDDKDTVVIYFDGWSFESFDDAKMALIHGIITKLEENERFLEKIKDNAKDLFSKIKKSVNWMRMLQIGMKTALPIIATSMTGGAALGPAIVAELLSKGNDLTDFLKSKEAAESINKIITTDGDNDEKYKAVREFREDFEKLIESSQKSRVVVLIDDLDRCLPRHIIDNLEAIKLFLNVKKTAFIIAADEFIVSNAIETEYRNLIDASNRRNGTNDKRDLGRNYMEKFIQLPYNLPTLSRKEVETYITLLFCQSELEKSDFDKIRNDFNDFYKSNKFDTYSWERISRFIGEQDSTKLKETVGFISKFSSIISHTLYGNPRLIKRFLNAYELRSSLLEESGLENQANRFVLLKLMLLEYSHEDLFKKIHDWVFAGNGFSKELLDLENAVSSNSNIENEWDIKDVKYLLSEEPKFSSVDLRELYWVSRDRLKDAMGGDSMIPIRIKKLLERILKASSLNILKNICNTEVKEQLTGEEYNSLFDLLDNHLLVNPKDKNGYMGYCYFILSDIDNSYNRFLSLLGRIDMAKVPISIGNILKNVLDKYNGDTKLYELISKNNELKKTVDSAK